MRDKITTIISLQGRSCRVMISRGRGGWVSVPVVSRAQTAECSERRLI